ncbi:kinase-like protein [Aureobasidium namibiae CBS 147.97]|uniref:non-specific serine/threonine protein kinase n=1 Tax=Aureobasidium namibiae CBS 147.97 TaxID=1043004 RepID=A0A074WL48_9PEZI|nr:kinase-like protein [Aureobasidium namibiae CBS 147.97]KEQ70532.1 kinase-like protein [Aureobasidium namibiae CBS 147.97]
MADANLLRPTSTRAPDEDSDHVGSGASTPPGGVSTPVPDLMDKRQPGLAHAYFAQVCHSFRAPFTSPTHPACPSSLSRSVTHGSSLNMDPSSTASAGAPPPTAPNSPKHSSLEPLDSEKRELTQDTKSTPPRTPRALSRNETAAVVDDAPAPTAPQISKIEKSSRSSSNQSSSQPTVGTTKGQLSVNIVQGRGLKPSTAPYVVCIYQLNEDISGGAENENLAKGVAMRRMGSDSGKAMSIPGLGSRQTSQTDISKLKDSASDKLVTEPLWNHEAVFDVVGDQSELDISVYDKKNQEAFIGHVRFSPNLENYDTPHEAWFKLKPREGESDNVPGEIQLRLSFQKTDKKTYGPEDFEILRLIGKGTFGQVFQVRKKDTQRIYAMKVLSKKVIIQKKEIAHTIGERNILVRTATAESPFIVGLKFSFQTPADLYLVTDYMSGGELFWHLQREGRFHEGRAKFYIAELILALRHLHQHDIVYRDLKPENILLDANGHIALCDFGLSKANLSKGDTTNTFCGTTEYLAPEVLLDEQGYTKMVDFWSLGVLVFEMCCGWSPFYAEDTQQMYKNIAFGKVRFPRDALSTEGRNFVKGLLNRNPNHRLGAKADADELMAHAFFADVDWDALGRKALVPPFKPKLKGELDVSNFDPEFTNALSSGNSSSLNARAAALASGVNPASTPLSPTLQTAFKGFTFVDESTLDKQFGNDANHVQQAQQESQEDSDELRKTSSKGERMSGVVSSSNEPQGIFNDGMDV